MDARTAVPEPARDLIAASRESAASAGLVYVTDERPGLTREPGEDGFRYRDARSRLVRDRATLERVRRLAIPPAWTDVWICPLANGHLQATGRDARGRKQYRYHPQFREERESGKYGRMVEFAHTLPRLRAQLAEHLALRGLPREKVLAAVVELLQSTLIRIGNDDYARSNGSFGLTTLRNRHVQVEGWQLRFRFQGKSGKTWQLKLQDRRIAKIVRACQELPGQELFQYLDEAGTVRRITSSDVNDYLRQLAGSDVTAKDFRTWAGTVMAALALQHLGPAESATDRKRKLRDAIAAVALRLGNTPTICRKCYVHPEVLAAYEEDALALDLDAAAAGEAGLMPPEAAVLEFLEQRLAAAAARQARPAARPRVTRRSPAAAAFRAGPAP
jgi:DNA topoisomerase-1